MRGNAGVTLPVPVRVVSGVHHDDPVGVLDKGRDVSPGHGRTSKRDPGDRQHGDHQLLHGSPVAEVDRSGLDSHMVDVEAVNPTEFSQENPVRLRGTVLPFIGAETGRTSCVRLL